jgi:hypothetical protein
VRACTLRTACVRRVYSSMPSYSSARELAHQETASSCPGVDIHPSFPATSPAFQLLRIASASTPSTSVHLSRSRTEHERPRLVNYSHIGFQLAASPSARTHTGTSLARPSLSVPPVTRHGRVHIQHLGQQMLSTCGAAQHSAARLSTALDYDQMQTSAPLPLVIPLSILG